MHRASQMEALVPGYYFFCSEPLPRIDCLTCGEPV